MAREDHNDSMASLTNLPTDILLLILSKLSVNGLAALSQTSSSFHNLISTYGWPMYTRRHPRLSYSLCNFISKNSPKTIARYNHLSDQNWHEPSFTARPLCRSWARKLQPTLAINSRRLAIAAGATIYCYTFTPGVRPGIVDEGSVCLDEPHVLGRNITNIAFLGQSDNTLLVAYQEGVVELVTLYPSQQSKSLSFTRIVCPGILPDTDYAESFSTTSTLLLSISQLGKASLRPLSSLTDTDDPSLASSIDICERGWKCFLSSSSGPTCPQDDTIAAHPTFAAFGTSGRTPLTIHSISPASGLSSTPEFVLHTPKAVDTWYTQLERLRHHTSHRLVPSPYHSGTSTPSSTSAPNFDWQTASGLATDPRITDRLPNLAVYGITRGPLGSPWGASPQVLVSGWFDGKARIYDMRDSGSICAGTSHSMTNGNGNPPHSISRPTFLRPVLSLSDRWLPDPIYTISCGGGNGSYIGAGMARHGVVAFWDVRWGGGECPPASPNKSLGRTGWSVHAPGNDESPVFEMVMESSRVFGATDRRGFVIDFGPTPTLEQYPAVPDSEAAFAVDGSRSNADSWRVTSNSPVKQGPRDHRGGKKGKQRQLAGGTLEVPADIQKSVSYRVVYYSHAGSGMGKVMS